MRKIYFVLVLFLFQFNNLLAQLPECFNSLAAKGYIIKEQSTGVTLYQKGSEKTYVEVVELNKGATIKILTGNVQSNVECSDGVYGGENTQFNKKTIDEFWNDFKSNQGAFSVVNGAFFNCDKCSDGSEAVPCYFNNSTETHFSFPLKIKDANIYVGGNKVDDDKNLRAFQYSKDTKTCRVTLFRSVGSPIESVSQITDESYYDDNVIVSHNAGGGNDQRTVIAVVNDDIIIIFCTEENYMISDVGNLLQQDFCVESGNWLNLDGNGSSDLWVNNQKYVNNTDGGSERYIPQAIGIFSGDKLSLNSPIVLTPSTVYQCSNVNISTSVLNSGGDDWTGKLYLSIHDDNDNFLGDILVTNNITIHSGDYTSISTAFYVGDKGYLSSGNLYRVYVKYQTEGTPSPNEFPIVDESNYLNPTFLPINYSSNCNSCTIPPGNYKKIEMYGLNINPGSEDLEFMYHAFPASAGDPIIDVESECARLKKIFKTAIVTPYYDQWISIDPTPEYYTQSWGNVVQPVAPLPFRNSEMANTMFMADLYLKQFWDAQFRVDAMNYWKSLVLQSPYWYSLHAKGFNNYAFYPSRAAIIPGLVSVNTSSNSVQVNQASLSVESENYHTPYVLPWNMNLSSLTQAENNDLNGRLQTFDSWVTSALSNREPAVRDLLNNHLAFTPIRQIYTTIALAKQYKLWNYPNKPMAELFDSENMTGISDPMIPDQDIVDLWNQQCCLVPAFNETISFSDFNGTSGHLTWGGCSMSDIDPIDSGILNFVEQIRDTVVFRHKSWIAQDSTVYFYGGVLNQPYPELAPIFFRRNSANIVLGDTIPIPITIYNFGEAPAQSFQVKLYERYFNSQNQLQSILIGQQIIASLDAFSYQNLTFIWTPQIYGSKNLFLTVDEGNAIVEKKENNNTAVDSINVLNNVPIIQISSPVNGSAISNKNILLSGSGSDNHDGYLQFENLSWSSSIVGFLGLGSYLVIDSLSVGNHVITLTGINSRGQTAIDYVNVYVVQQGFPIVQIISPSSGDTLPNNSSVLFSGTANDLDEGSLCSSASWTSSLDGLIGNGCSLNDTLGIGNHEISLSAQNGSGNISTAGISVVVVDGNPHLTILSPSAGANYLQNQTVLLSASAFDFPQGNISNQIRWYSNLQGFLGTGSTFTLSLLPGTHNIKAVVQDNSGSIDSAVVNSVHILFNPPVPIIQLPLANSTYQYHDVIKLKGRATDLQDGVLHGQYLQWYSNLQGFIGSGDSISLSTLQYGNQIISLRAIDYDGEDSMVSVNIYIDAGLPVVTIQSPLNNDSAYFGYGVLLKGYAADPQDGEIPAAHLSWYSSLDGNLGTGDSLVISSLTPGEHIISLTAFDSEGFLTTRTINLHVEPPNPPAISIYYPFNNNHFLHGSTVSLKASASDYEDGVLANNNVTWSSSLDGNLGTGKIISINTLTPGTHVISATAIDTIGLFTVAAIQIIVDEQKPVTQIVSPASGSVFSQGTNITITGSASDFEDGTLTGSSLHWSSNVDGNLGSGAIVNTSSLSVGSHVIKLVATDSQNAKDSVQEIIIIQGAHNYIQTKFYPIEDSISKDFSYAPSDTIVYISLPKTANVVNAQMTIGILQSTIGCGAIDTTFNPNGDGASFAVATTVLQTDGKTIIGGSFSSYNNIPRNNIARLNSDGSLDMSFDPGSGPNTTVFSALIQPDGKIIIGGFFTSYNGTPRNYIARLNTDGTLDMSFDLGTGANAQVNSAVIQPDGKIIIGGFFTSYNGTPRNYISRLNTDGTLDMSFDIGTGANFVINSVLLQSDGKIIIGGDFISYNGIARNRIARLNSDGSLDLSFDPGTGANNGVFSILLQPDSKIIIGGIFDSYNGTSRHSIARLNTDGLLDMSFNPGTGAVIGGVASILRQADERIIIAGDFISYNGIARNRIARLNSDGSLDSSFDPGTGANSHITSALLQPDFKIIVGGYFTYYNGTEANRIARILNSIESYPVNPYIDVSNNNTYEWSYTGLYNSIEITSNFANEVNNYLFSAIAEPNGNVLVPIKVHTDSAGIIVLKNLNIQYLFVDTIAPTISAFVNPNPVNENTIFTVIAQINDNDLVDSAIVLFHDVTYEMTNAGSDTFITNIISNDAGVFPVKIFAYDVDGLQKDTTLYLTVYSATNDLEVISNNLSIQPLNIFTNDSAHVTAIVKNNSNATITNVQVALIIDGVTNQISTINIGSLSQTVVTFSWLAKWGQDTITVKADPNNYITEANKDNNAGTVYINVNDPYPPLIIQALATPNPAVQGAQVLFKVKAIDSTGMASVSINWLDQNVILVYNSGTTFYEGFLTATTEGLSVAVVTVTDINGLSANSSINIQVLQNLPDLVIYPSEISFNADLGSSGQNDTLSLNLRNTGNVNATNVTLFCKADGALFSSQQVNVPADSFTMVTVNYSVNCGNHLFTFEADSANLITELNDSNNIATVSHQFCIQNSIQSVVATVTPTQVQIDDPFLLSVSVLPDYNGYTVNATWNNQDYTLNYNNTTHQFEVGLSAGQVGNFTIPVSSLDSFGIGLFTSVQIQVYDSTPDISITQLTLANYPAFANVQNNFTSTVSNNSLDTLNDVKILLKINGINFDSITTAVMLPLADSTVSFSWLPTIGNFHAEILVDPYNDFNESNLANNYSDLNITISDNQPPIIYSVSTSLPIYQGGTFTITSVIFDNVAVASAMVHIGMADYNLIYDSLSQTSKTQISGLISGDYSSTVTAFDNSGLSTSATLMIHVNDTLPDAEVLPQNIFFEQLSSDSTLVNCVIQNIGGGSANSLLIYLIVDGGVPDSIFISLASGQSDTAQFYFLNTIGNYSFTFTADPHNAITESNDSNNTATRSLFIPDANPPGSPVVTVIPSAWSDLSSFAVSWTTVSDDNGSVTYEYSVNGNSWIEVGSSTSTNALATVEGLNYVYVRARDSFGNVGTPGIGEMKYDNTAPNAPIIAEYNCGTSWTTHASPLLEWINPGDIGSGIEHFEVSVDNQTPINIGFELTFQDTLTTGTHTLKVRATDYVDHLSAWSNEVTVHIDLDNPDCPNISSSSHPDQNQWYQSDSVVLNWEHPTETSSVTGFFYMLNHDANFYADQTTYWTTEDSLTITTIPSMDTAKIRLPDGIWYVHISSQDTVGHLSSASCSYRVKIDKSPPQSHLNEEDTIYGCSTQIIIAADDYYSGVAETYFRIDGGSWSQGSDINIPQVGNHLVEFYSVDSANNVEVIDSENLFFANDNLSLNLGVDTFSCGELILNGPSNYEYHWSTGDVTQSLQVLQSGTYSLVIVDSSGCSTSDSIHVNILQEPISNFIYSQIGDSIYFYNQSQNTDSIIWFFDDGDSSNVLNPVHHFQQNGFYIVQLWAFSDSCGISVSSDTVAYIGTSSLQTDSDKYDFKLYPNPTTENFTLSFFNPLDEDLKVELLNMLGQVVLSIYEGSSAIKFKKEIDATALPASVYYVRVLIGNSTLTKKLVKQ